MRVVDLEDAVRDEAAECGGYHGEGLEDGESEAELASRVEEGEVVGDPCVEAGFEDSWSG